MKKASDVEFCVVERDTFIRDYRKIIETHASEERAWGRVKYHTQTKGGGGKFYTVEKS